MKISIVVPSYNYARFLQACLFSIQTQDYINFEVLIADGGSKDDSLQIIQHLCAQDRRFQLVSTADHGQADAIEKAFAQATGDIYCFLNADDCYLCTDALTSVVEAFNAYPGIDLLSFGGYYLDADGRWIRPIRYRYHPLDGFHLMRYRTAVLQPATFWRKAVYSHIDWPRQFHYVFDVVFFYAAYQAFSWLELSKPIAGYRLHGDNKSTLIRPPRINELAQFEEIKFGRYSARSHYLYGIARLVRAFNHMGSFGNLCCRFLYLLVNFLAFISVYRLPGI